MNKTNKNTNKKHQLLSALGWPYEQKKKRNIILSFVLSCRVVSCRCVASSGRTDKRRKKEKNKKTTTEKQLRKEQEKRITKTSSSGSKKVQQLTKKNDTAACQQI